MNYNVQIAKYIIQKIAEGIISEFTIYNDNTVEIEGGKNLIYYDCDDNCTSDYIPFRDLTLPTMEYSYISILIHNNTIMAELRRIDSTAFSLPIDGILEFFRDEIIIT